MGQIKYVYLGVDEVGQGALLHWMRYSVLVEDQINLPE